MSDTESSFPSITDTTSNSYKQPKNKTRKIPKTHETGAKYLPPVKAPHPDGSLFYTRNNVAAIARADLGATYTAKVNKAFNQDAVYDVNLETGETAKIGPKGQRYPVSLPPIKPISLPPITKGGIKTRKAKRSKKTRKHKRRSSTSKTPHRKNR